MTAGAWYDGAGGLTNEPWGCGAMETIQLTMKSGKTSVYRVGPRVPDRGLCHPQYFRSSPQGFGGQRA